MVDSKPVSLKCCLFCNGQIPLKDGCSWCLFCLGESHMTNRCSVWLSFSARTCESWDAWQKLHLLKQSVKVSSSDKLQDPDTSPSLADNQHHRQVQRRWYLRKDLILALPSLGTKALPSINCIKTGTYLSGTEVQAARNTDTETPSRAHCPPIRTDNVKTLEINPQSQHCVKGWGGAACSTKCRDRLAEWAGPC